MGSTVVFYVAQRGSCPFIWALQGTLLCVALLSWFVCWRLPGLHVALKSCRHEKNEVNRVGVTSWSTSWSLISTLWMHSLISSETAHVLCVGNTTMRGNGPWIRGPCSTLHLSAPDLTFFSFLSSAILLTSVTLLHTLGRKRSE